ncbi:MAG: hypothetical protein OEW15_08045 [Nitrospirota bacterium]|nr:hypothetical protein [Nitrospirota bacterium]
MKKTIFIMTLAMFTFAFGTAFAWNDDAPFMINENAYYAPVFSSQDFGSTGPRIAEYTNDDVPVYYEKRMRGETILTERAVRGTAAGGVSSEAGDKAWDSFAKTISPDRASDQLPVL